MKMALSNSKQAHIFDLQVNTDGNSPNHEYYSLSPNFRSPRHGLLSRANLSLMIMMFGAGVLLGGICTKISARMDSGSTFSKQQLKDWLTISGKSSLRRNGDADDSLKIAWLMSFPNSGTSYTSYMVKRVTGHNTATNYGLESQDEDGQSPPVINDSPGGPFWLDTQNPNLSKPERGYLLTKTHCGGRCEQCGPSSYIENHQLFLKHCLEGEYITDDGHGKLNTITGHYDKNLVARAVHLIRDPFDNIVSRFHLAHNKFAKRNEAANLAKYQKTRDGFRAFCNDFVDRFRNAEKESTYYSDVFEVVKDIPCHADFFRFVQWHNLAFTTTWDLGIPTMIVHYENYTSNFNQTKDMLLEFLDQDNNNEPPEFITGKTYREYFTEEEVVAVSELFSTLALDKTWNHTKHYFE